MSIPVQKYFSKNNKHSKMVLKSIKRYLNNELTGLAFFHSLFITQLVALPDYIRWRFVLDKENTVSSQVDRLVGGN